MKMNQYNVENWPDLYRIEITATLNPRRRAFRHSAAFKEYFPSKVFAKNVKLPEIMDSFLMCTPRGADPKFICSENRFWKLEISLGKAILRRIEPEVSRVECFLFARNFSAFHFEEFSRPQVSFFSDLFRLPFSRADFKLESVRSVFPMRECK